MGHMCLSGFNDAVDQPSQVLFKPSSSSICVMSYTLGARKVKRSLDTASTKVPSGCRWCRGWWRRRRPWDTGGPPHRPRTSTHCTRPHSRPGSGKRGRCSALSRILARSGVPSEGWPCSRCSSWVGSRPRGPHTTPESGVGAQCMLSRPRKPMYSRLPLVAGGPATALISTLARLQRRCLCWQAGRTLSSPGLFIKEPGAPVQEDDLVWAETAQS